MSTISLWWVGRLEEDLPPLEEMAGARVERIDDLAAAERLLTSGSQTPELIVLAQSRPGQFSTAAIDRLRRLAPLTRIARVLGSWCEGEARSGRPPSGCTHTYWHAWPARWARDVAKQQAGVPPEWAFPVTLSAEERALAAAEFPIERRTGTIAICARHSSSAVALADVCRLAGYTPRIGREGQPCRPSPAIAVIWDADVERLSDPVSIRRAREMAPEAPLVAVATFPRADDCRLALESGVAAVIAKPLVIHDLLWQLDQVAR